MGKTSKSACGKRSGFSLIEILVATSILLVIVVLASLVFQQMTGAYQTGGRKMDSQVVLRNVIGAVTRDLALAVDDADYPGLDVNSFSDGNSITFLALTGRPGLDANNNSVRTAQVISYSLNGNIVKRTEQATTCVDGNWSATGRGTPVDLNGPENPIEQFEFVIDASGPFPDRVYIRAEIATDDHITSVGAGSSGRNGQFETGGGKSDDIYVGLNPNRAPGGEGTCQGSFCIQPG